MAVLRALLAAAALMELVTSETSPPPTCEGQCESAPRADWEAEDTVALLQQLGGMRGAGRAERPCRDGGRKLPSFSPVPYGEQALWASAYEGWEMCGGEMQSPINLKTCNVTTTMSPPLANSLGSGAELMLVNNGHAVEVDGKFGTVSVDGSTFESLQFHFHQPSEHTVDGRAAAAEIHVVSKDGSGRLAVVGVLLDVGAPNVCLEEVLRNVPLAGCERELERLDLACFKEQLAGPYWTYLGSLTTPPCTEGVRWTVMQRRATLSRKQLQTLLGRYLHNARATQPLNGRELTLHKIRRFGAA